MITIQCERKHNRAWILATGLPGLNPGSRYSFGTRSKNLTSLCLRDICRTGGNSNNTHFLAGRGQEVLCVSYVKQHSPSKCPTGMLSISPMRTLRCREVRRLVQVPRAVWWWSEDTGASSLGTSALLTMILQQRSPSNVLTTERLTHLYLWASVFMLGYQLSGDFLDV